MRRLDACHLRAQRLDCEHALEAQPCEVGLDACLWVQMVWRLNCECFLDCEDAFGLEDALETQFCGVG